MSSDTQREEKLMATLKCRGDDAKAAIVRAYELTAVTHTLVPGQELRCCCGDAITGGHEYHLLRATPRPGQTLDPGVLYAGSGCAPKLARLDPTLKLLPLADPFAIAINGDNGGGRGGQVNGNGERIAPHPLAREIATAHAILVLYFGEPKAGGPLDDVAMKLSKLGADRPPPSMARTINSIARKLGGLSAVWVKLTAKYRRDVPLPQFHLMSEILGEDSCLLRLPQ